MKVNLPNSFHWKIAKLELYETGRPASYCVSYVNLRRQTLFEVTQIKLQGQLYYDVSHTTVIVAIQR